MYRDAFEYDEPCCKNCRYGGGGQCGYDEDDMPEDEMYRYIDDDDYCKHYAVAECDPD
jgi:hypothetical protein